MRIATRAVHAGQSPDAPTGAVVPPIFQNSTFAQDAIGVHRGYEYARTQNPTRRNLEINLAALEGGRFGHAFASGMSAVTAVAMLLESGDHVVLTDNVYGGTYRLFATVLKRMGIRFTGVDTSDLDRVADAIESRTRLLFIESPTNPILTLTDLKAACSLARDRGILTCVDNTFMSPVFQRPLELGADIALHSTTKYINGHADVVGGAVVHDSETLGERLAFIQNTVGAVPSPFDCWLVQRGVKTLPLRMAAHDRNARRLARYLESHPKVERVYYPGLESHPQHDLARRQMSGFGGMISFVLDDLDAANRFAQATRIFTLAESLGGVESLVCHPGRMTHAAVPESKRLALGITDGLVRLSVGIEDVEDLLDDLEAALKAV